MNKDLIYSAELANDSGVDASPFLGEALDSVVEQLMAGEKVPGLRWQLMDFLEDQSDLAELSAAAIISGDFVTFKDMVERALRRELQDHDCVFDLAAQLAAEKPEEE